MLLSRCLAASCHFPDGKKQNNKKRVMNKHFLEILPPKESDSIMQNVMNYVLSILGRLLTSEPGQEIQKNMRSHYCSLAAGNTVLAKVVFLRALLSKLEKCSRRKVKGLVREKDSHVKFKVQKTKDNEKTMPYQE